MRDDSYRKRVAENITHKPVADFWKYEFPKFAFGYRTESTSPIVNKVSAFLSYPVLYKIFTEEGEMLDFRKIMDERKILLVNLAAGKLGFDAAGLLGGMLVTSLGLAAFSRADTPEEERPAHYLYLDEFQNVTTQSLAIFLAELRKFKLAIVMAHQYMHQLDTDIQHAVLGNAGTLVSFRLGAKDAPLLAREFEPKFETVDLLNLPNYDIYLKLMIDGTPSQCPDPSVTWRPDCIAGLARETLWCRNDHALSAIVSVGHFGGTVRTAGLPVPSVILALPIRDFQEEGAPHES